MGEAFIQEVEGLSSGPIICRSEVSAVTLMSAYKSIHLNPDAKLDHSHCDPAQDILQGVVKLSTGILRLALIRIG